MLISAVPSLQAVYKPLTSIRFFRNICIALFGDNNLRNEERSEDYLREFCEGNIYWTHYRKCYQPGITDFSHLDSYCADKYLIEELNVLQPELVIVLGNEIHDKIRRIVPKIKAEFIYKPFPTLENAAGEFQDVREKLAKYTFFFRDSKGNSKIRFVFKDGANRYYESSAQLRGNETHLRFELNAFEKMLSGTEKEIGNYIEDLWYRNIVVPNMRRCVMLVQTFSFIENQIKVMASDFITSTGQLSVLSELRSRSHNATIPEALDEIRRHWKDPVLMDIAVHRNRELNVNALEEKVRKIVNKLKILAEYRNAIVHTGSMMRSRATRNEARNDLQGIYSFVGTIFISSEGEKTFLQFAREVTELLCEIQ